MLSTAAFRLAAMLSPSGVESICKRLGSSTSGPSGPVVARVRVRRRAVDRVVRIYESVA